MTKMTKSSTIDGLIRAQERKWGEKRDAVTGPPELTAEERVKLEKEFSIVIVKESPVVEHGIAYCVKCNNILIPKKVRGDRCLFCSVCNSAYPSHKDVDHKKEVITIEELAEALGLEDEDDDE